MDTTLILGSAGEEDAVMTNLEDNAFGRLLQRERQAHGLTQREMAAELGITRNALSQWELGSLGYPVQPHVIEALERLTGVPEVMWLRAQGFRLQLGEASESRLRLLRMAHLTAQEEELLRKFRLLAPGQRETVLRIIQALSPPTPEPQTSDAKHRRPRSKS